MRSVGEFLLQAIAFPSEYVHVGVVDEAVDDGDGDGVLA
jgi:hypothetical protein